MSSNRYLDGRVVEIAEYIIETKATVRQTACEFAMSKSTVHKEIMNRLVDVRPDLYDEVRTVLEINKAERCMRGGLATRKKYQQMRHNERGGQNA